MTNAKGQEEDTPFTTPISRHIWEERFRLAEPGAVPEPTIQKSWARVALALSAAEPHHRDLWRERYTTLLTNFRFLPDAHILTSAGTKRRVTLFNCFVMGKIDDSIDAIFNALREAMLTLQEGSHIGCDFSTIRPAGEPALGTGKIASGPVSFMPVWNSACATLLSDGRQQASMTAVLRCDHPDIEQFIDAKRDLTSLKNISLSVLISDDFMRAVEQGAPWPLVFPLAGRPIPAGGVVCERTWGSAVNAEPCLVIRTVQARALWEHLLQAAYECGEPQVIFIDRVRHANNLWYIEQVSATTPCGETPLPPHGACVTGSVNLTQFVENPYGPHPKLDTHALASVTTVAVRMLDNVYDTSHFPIKSQKNTALASRRLGLGITGLADAFIMLGVRYGSESSIEIADVIMQSICHAAYRASIELAEERGSFPAYRASEYTASDFILTLPREMIDAIMKNGIRNSHLTAIGAATSTSQLANNVSRGMQPVMAFQSERKIMRADKTMATMPVQDYAWALFRQLHGNTKLTQSFVEAKDVDPADQIKLQSVVQGYIDNAVSKTIVAPGKVSFGDFCKLYQQAYDAGLKGCAVSLIEF